MKIVDTNGPAFCLMELKTEISPVILFDITQVFHDDCPRFFIGHVEDFTLNQLILVSGEA